MNKKCTVVVSSCDLYSDVWDLLFKSMQIQWPDRPYPIVLNTESYEYDYEDMGIQTFRFYRKGESTRWGERLRRTLKVIDSEYILFFLDDFILTDKVPQRRIEKCIEWMDENPQIATFCFRETPGPNIQDELYDGFELRPQDGLYRLNCQTAIWRREKLINYIKNFEDPWQWETVGSKRSKRYKEKFYSAKHGQQRIFEYPNGGVIWRGLWTSEAKKLVERYDVPIDLTIRGFMDENNPYRQEPLYSVVHNFPNGIFTRKFYTEVAKRLKEKWKFIRSIV